MRTFHGVAWNGGCQHKCNNTIGSYLCSCNDGYALVGDDRSCVGEDKTSLWKQYFFINRSSHQRCSVKQGVLRNFARLFFNKVAGLRLATSLKKSLWRRCFSVHFAKFLITFFTEHLRRTASE